jgi:protein-L-isoaspartate(D-aspartate) O-methyltransferase
VDSALVNQAYEDTSLPIGLGQTISKPSVVARMCRAAAGRLVTGHGQAGPGAGDRHRLRLPGGGAEPPGARGLQHRAPAWPARQGAREPAAFRLANVHLMFGDGMAGYAKGAPYAGIIAAAGGEAIPQAWTGPAGRGRTIWWRRWWRRPGTQALVVIDKTGQGLRQTGCWRRCILSP